MDDGGATGRDRQALASDRMFRALVAQLPDGVCIHDQGRIIFANEAHWRMLGFESVDEIIGADGFQFIAEEDRGLVRERIASRLRGEAVPPRYEIRSRRRDGSTFDSEVVASTVEVDGRRLFLVVLRDITERKRAEAALREAHDHLEKRVVERTAALTRANEALRDEIQARERSQRALAESEEVHRALVSASPDAIVALDLDANIFEVSDQALKLFGITRPDEAIGRNALDFVVPEDQDRARRELRRTLAASAPEAVTFTLLRGDGSSFIAEVTATAIRDGSGEPKAFMTITHDVTHRKRTEEQLQLLSEAVAQSAEGIAVADMDGTFVFVNEAAAQMHGYAADEVVGQHLSIWHLPEQMPDVSAGIERLVERGSLRAEFWHARRDGTVFPADMRGSLLRNERGEAVAMLALMSDATAKRRALQETMHAQKAEALGLLAGGVAHDFNNLLAGIMVNVAAIEHSSGGTDDASFQDIMHAVTRARDLTQQLLTFSRGGAPVRRAASIAELLRDTGDFVLSGSTVSCGYDLTEDLWPVSIDVVQISQVVQNVIMNAKQAMPDGGRITITARNQRLGEGEHPGLPEGRYVTVTIRDTGGGMAQDVVSRALDPYFTTKAAGNGLGLAVADAIIQRHGGYIRIVSQLNEGTTVEFILPASPECASCPPAEPAAAANGQGHILVMDDEAVIRNGASRLLPALGYTVTCAADGAEAVEQYEAALTNGSPFDAVVLDLTVPGGMGGEECMKRLRAIDPNVKAIVASGYSLDPAIADHRSYGFLDVVRKPYSPAELAAALRQAMVGSPTR